MDDERKPWCCFIGCYEKPEWEIEYASHPRESSHACTRHVGDLLEDDVHTIYPIPVSVTVTVEGE